MDNSDLNARLPTRVFEFLDTNTDGLLNLYHAFDESAQVALGFTLRHNVTLPIFAAFVMILLDIPQINTQCKVRAAKILLGMPPDE